MTRARISVVTSLVATAMVVSGCAISAVTGTPVPSLSSAPGTPTYDRSADAVLIALTESHTTVAGPQGSSSVVVFGDGRMVRTAADGVTSEELRIDETGVAELVSQHTSGGSSIPRTSVTSR